MNERLVDWLTAFGLLAFICRFNPLMMLGVLCLLAGIWLVWWSLKSHSDPDGFAQERMDDDGGTPRG